MDRAEQGSKNTKRILRSYGMIQPWQVKYWPLMLIIIVVFVVIMCWLSLSLIYSFVPNTIAKDIATIALATGGFIVAYHQWRAARQETSMDKFYERLEKANNRLTQLNGIDPLHLYVFAELDNLEYVVEKYRLGYMSEKLALRGLFTFQSRFRGVRGKEFKDYASVAVKGAAYSTNVEQVFNCIIQKE